MCLHMDFHVYMPCCLVRVWVLCECIRCALPSPLCIYCVGTLCDHHLCMAGKHTLEYVQLRCHNVLQFAHPYVCRLQNELSRRGKKTQRKRRTKRSGATGEGTETRQTCHHWASLRETAQRTSTFFFLSPIILTFRAILHKTSIDASMISVLNKLPPQLASFRCSSLDGEEIEEDEEDEAAEQEVTEDPFKLIQEQQSPAWSGKAGASCQPNLDIRGKQLEQFSVTC